MQNKNDRRWVILTSIMLLLLTSVPYLIGYFRQGTEWHFTGFIFGVEDGNSYIAKMLSGTYGSWLFRSPYTTMPQDGVLAFLPYILLGKLAYPPEIHDQLVALFQLFRWLSGGLLVWAVYSFTGIYIVDGRLRKFATVIILVGGGLGWLGWLLFPGEWTGRLPLEFYSPEAFGFLSLLGLPHLSAARALLLFGLIYFLKKDYPSIWLRNSLYGGVCWFLVGFFQPLTIVVGYGILACFLVITFIVNKGARWQSTLPLLKKATIIAAIASPWVIYNMFFFGTDPYLQAWYRQNIIDSPPPSHYLWSYAVFMVAAIPAVVKSFRHKNQRALLLIAWVICAALLAYFPYNVQRRFIDGIWIALILLVMMSVQLVNRTNLKKAYYGLIGLCVIAPSFMLLIVSRGIWTVSEPVYRTSAEISLFKEIELSAKQGDTVLAAYDTANALPAWAPVFVLAGHGPESANLKSILPDIEKFYSGVEDKQWQERFLSNNSVDYIVIEPHERLFTSNLVFSGRKFIKIYDKSGYQLFRVESLNGN